MTSSYNPLRMKIEGLLTKWQEKGLPSRSGLESAARELLEWKRAEGITGLWKNPPLMLTATLDDGMGFGLELIHLYADVAGLQVLFLGLLQSPEKILDECRKNLPDLLGLTVLQFDSEEALTKIGHNLPTKTQIIAGGPVFMADPDFAMRAGTHFVAKNVASFLRFLLNFRDC